MKPTVRVGFDLQELGEVKTALRVYKGVLEKVLSKGGMRLSERAMTRADLQYVDSSLKKVEAASKRLIERL